MEDLELTMVDKNERLKLSVVLEQLGGILENEYGRGMV